MTASNETRSVIRDFALYLPMVAHLTKGGFREGQAYTITRYRTYDSRGRCDACERDHQAGKQVFIQADNQESELLSGTSCLQECFGVSEAALEKHVQGRRGVGTRVQRLSGQLFENELDMLQQLRWAFTMLPAGYPEVTKVVKILDGLTVPFHDGANDQLNRILDFYALMHEGIFYSERYRDRLQALTSDPVYRRKSNAIDFRHLEALERLTLTRAEELRTIMKSLVNTKLNSPDPTLHPWDFPDEAAYQAGARAHYIQLADAGATRPDALQASYDHQHFSYELDAFDQKRRFRPAIEDLLAPLKLPTTLPVVEDSVISRSRFEDDGTLRWLERNQCLNHRSLSQGHYLSRVIHLGSIRTDPPEQRAQRGQARAEHLSETRYWCAVYWPVLSWNPVYDVWDRYREQGGRRYLLTFPEVPDILSGRLHP